MACPFGLLCLRVFSVALWCVNLSSQTTFVWGRLQSPEVCRSAPEKALKKKNDTPADPLSRFHVPSHWFQASLRQLERPTGSPRPFRKVEGQERPKPMSNCMETHDEINPWVNEVPFKRGFSLPPLKSSARFNLR